MLLSSHGFYRFAGMPLTVVASREKGTPLSVIIISNRRWFQLSDEQLMALADPRVDLLI